jgi:cell wall-associated NlpC family hydrolase
MTNVMAGDLLFFGSRAREGRKERVTHVGISLGGKRFIHCAGDVHINSLDSSDPDFSGPRLDGFLHVRRIIGAGEDTGVRHISHIPYYRAHAF